MKYRMKLLNKKLSKFYTKKDHESKTQNCSLTEGDYEIKQT